MLSWIFWMHLAHAHWLGRRRRQRDPVRPYRRSFHVEGVAVADGTCSGDTLVAVQRTWMRGIMSSGYGVPEPTVSPAASTPNLVTELNSTAVPGGISS